MPRLDSIVEQVHCHRAATARDDLDAMVAGFQRYNSNSRFAERCPSRSPIVIKALDRSPMALEEWRSLGDLRRQRQALCGRAPAIAHGVP